MSVRRFLSLAVLPSVAFVAHAQEARVLDVENGTRIPYTFQTHPADAHLPDRPPAQGATDAVGLAKLITEWLAAGWLEEVALLSNAPKARFARLRESFGDWTPDEFGRAFGRYFSPDNRIVGEAVIGTHRMVMWHLKDSDHLTAYYFVEVDGKLRLDDVPSETRTQLRRVLESFRAKR